MSRRLRQRIQVLCVPVVVLFLAYLYSLAPVKIVGPSQWDRLTQDGLRALGQRQFTEAERLLNDALHEAERTPTIRIGRPTSLQNLGDLRFAQSRYSEARDLYREALEGLESIPTVPTMQRATLCNNLAVTLLSTGEGDEAEPLFRRAIDLAQDPFTGERLKAAAFMRHYAGFLLSTGRGRESLEWVKRASEMEDVPATSIATPDGPR